MRRVLFPLALGLCGIAILMSLGFWQLRRLEWKETMLDQIAARIDGTPVDVFALGSPDPETQIYLPVTASGRTTGQEILVLSGQKHVGAGYEVIAVLETDGGRRILIDRGFLSEDARDAARPPVALTVTGNLHWPNESDAYTPPPDATTGLWFARDVKAMAESLETDPLMVVIRTAEGDAQGIVPRPVDTSGIPNDHMNYAITWFSLAAVWAGMTLYLLWRIRRRTI
ncbi:SURF1 family protein [Defluviimonas sp. WL0002]|uniref:SURF1-like protein n=1 Tax=Albidovulum marisflavi TaxID=2984159 RepID=A0ABT2ZA71_9RHOB|nr:SURF1 family protein [Defluviimonas sp. WL0002]MCV2868024.1 SURF1 family protein [Defluviimonas sp. WL0002]